MGKVNKRPKVQGQKMPRKSFLDNQKKQRKELKENKKVKEKAETGRRSFKFVSVADQIAATDCSIVYQLASSTNIHQKSDDGLSTSVFHTTLIHWISLNKSRDFRECGARLYNFITLPQVLLSQKEIFSELKSALDNSTELSVQPFLELTSALATDLQQEFYPNLDSILKILIHRVLKPQEPEVIKYTFRCMGHLLKILWRPISQNIEEVYTTMSDLFRKRSEFMRYIGAEAVSFLLRKIRDKKKFISFILSQMDDTVDQVAVAKLFFESVKAVNEQFNSQLDVTLKALMEVLPGQYDNVLNQFTKFCFEHTTVEHVKPIRDQLVAKLQAMQNTESSTDIILDCLNILITTNNGKLVKDLAYYLNFFIGCIKKDEENSQSLFMCLKNLLVNDKLIKTSDQYELAIDALLRNNFKIELVSSLISETEESCEFNSYYLRPYLTWVHTHLEQSFDMISSQLSDVLNKKCGSCEVGTDLANWEFFTYDLNFVPAFRKLKKGQSLVERFIKKLDIAETNKILKTSLIVSRTFKPVDKQKLTSCLTNIMNQIINQDLVDKSEILPELFKTLFILNDQNQIQELIPLTEIVNFYLKHPENIHVLKFFDFCLTLHSWKNIHECNLEDRLEDLFEALSNQLISWEPEVRLMALHSMTIVVPLLGSEYTNAPDLNYLSIMDVVNTLFKAQNMQEDFKEYKGKEQILGTLAAERLHEKIITNPKLVAIMLKFLLGSLYTNMTLLWKPIQNLIVGFGQQVTADIFWKIYHDQLLKTNLDIEERIDQVQEGKQTTCTQDGRQVDFFKYRKKLWLMMAEFINMVEAKHRDFGPMFLDDYMKKELVAIRKLQESDVEFSEKRDVEYSKTDSIVAQLTIFSNFKNLHGMYRHEELKDIAFKLLSDKTTEIQKMAVSILVAFKLNYIKPYESHIAEILSESGFYKGLKDFPLSGENSPVVAADRDQLIPVLMRLLHGLMQGGNISNKKSNNASAENKRRMVVLSYMMDLSEAQIRTFLNFVFGDLYTDCEGLQVDREKAGASESVYAFILADNTPPRKSNKDMEHILNITKAIINKFEKLMDKNLDIVLETILWVGYIVDHVYRSEGKLATVKPVRNTMYEILSTFFDTFSNFDCTQQIEEVILKCFVWRSLDNFEKDFIQSPTGLLKLLLSWSNQRKMHRFFLREHPVQKTPLLHNVMKVLVNPDTNSKVINSVLQIVNNLVAQPENKEDMMEVEGQEENAAGIQAVLPELGPIISHFNNWIVTSTGDVKKNNTKGRLDRDNKKDLRKIKALDSINKGIQRKMDILRNLAPFINDTTVAFQFIQQLLSLTLQMRQPKEVCKVLEIVVQLSSAMDDDYVVTIIPLILPFYTRKNNRDVLVMLGKLLGGLKDRSKGLDRLCKFCINLTSFDKKRFEEPDFEGRMLECIEIREIARNQDATFTASEMTALINIFSTTLSTETDAALRSNSLDTFLHLCTGLKNIGEKAPETAEKLVNSLMDLISKGCRNKDVSIRSDYIAILQKLVIECRGLIPRLNNMAQLINDDLDLDFFENIRHTQVYIRRNAIDKLYEDLKENPEMLWPKNLMQFILPNIECYFLDSEIADKHSYLVESSIKLFGLICSLLNWKSYEARVKYYIGLFKKPGLNQKRLTKVVLTILDAFSFNINLENLEGLDEVEIAKRRKINFAVKDSLLPSLIQKLSGRNKERVRKDDDSGKDTDDQLLQKLNLAVPVIKILQLFSTKELEKEIPGIIAKVGTFLKSKSESLRLSVRTILMSIMGLLGPRYLSFMVGDLSLILTKGYELHVLIYNVESVINMMMEKGMLETGDLDNCVNELVELAFSDMFSKTAEEKEEQKILSKTFEARANKSYTLVKMLGMFISSNYLMNLVKPFADKLKGFSTHKNIYKIKTCLKNMASGLLNNKDLDPVLAVMFIYALLTDNLSLTYTESGVKKVEVKDPVVEKADCFLISRAPRRGFVKAKSTASKSKYVLQEFGLNLLFFLLKRSLLTDKNPAHCARLTPLYPVIIGYLDSQHASVIAVAIRCLIWIVKMPLECITDANMMVLTNKVFMLLKRYGAGTDCEGENADLVTMATKLLSVLIRNYNLTQIQDDQMKIVFEFVVIDVMDPFKQSTAFGLLNAVLTRRIIHADLHNLMMKLAELLIFKSENTELCQNVRSSLLSYMTKYELKEKLGDILDFFIAQLKYEQDSGRIAAAKTLSVIFKSQGELIDSHAEFLFISMAPHLSNTDSENTRKCITSAIGGLLAAVSSDKANALLDNTMIWFQADDSLPKVVLAIRLLGIFVGALGIQVIKTKMKVILLKLNTLFKSNDNALIQVLSLFQKIARKDQKNTIFKNSTTLDNIKSCMMHGHTWIRLLSAQLIGLYLAQVAEKPESGLDTWIHGEDNLRSLILDSFEQLKLVEIVTAEMSVQIMKNLVALTKLIKPPNENEVVPLSLEFVLKSSIKISNFELVRESKQVVKRTLVFNYIAAVVINTDKQNISKDVLSLIITPLQREVSNSSSDEGLRKHAQEVLDLIKKKFVDDEMFTKTLVEVQMNLKRVRNERSENMKRKLILDPEMAAKEKVRKAERRKVANKRKQQAKYEN